MQVADHRGMLIIGGRGVLLKMRVIKLDRSTTPPKNFLGGGVIVHKKNCTAKISSAKIVNAVHFTKVGHERGTQSANTLCFL